MKHSMKHTSIRISEAEQAFLASGGWSILEATRIGIMALKLMAQSGTGSPGYYICTTGDCGTQLWHSSSKASSPPSACCPGCPIRNGLAKRYLSAHCNGMNDPAFNPAPLIDVQDLGPSLASQDPIHEPAAEVDLFEDPEPDPCNISLQDLVVVDDQEPEPVPERTPPMRAPTAAELRESFERLKKERTLVQ